MAAAASKTAAITQFLVRGGVDDYDGYYYYHCNDDDDRNGAYDDDAILPSPCCGERR